MVLLFIIDLIQEIQRTQQTSIVLRNLTSYTRYTFKLCPHNEASLSNLGSNSGKDSLLKCTDISDTNTVTKEGCKYNFNSF